MNKKEDLSKVLGFIEENMRVTDQTSIEYLDSQGIIERLTLKQNHIVFGRRGSGKSLLLKSLRDRSKFAFINVNMEDFKDISFPNSIIHVQKAIIKQLLPSIENKHSKFTYAYYKKSRPLIAKLKKQNKVLEHHLSHPDEYDKSIREKKAGKSFGKGKVKVKSGNYEVEGGAEESDETETSKQLRVDKLDVLKNDLSNIKELFSEASELIEKDIFLILDDFYFIRKD